VSFPVLYQGEQAYRVVWFFYTILKIPSSFEPMSHIPTYSIIGIKSSRHTQFLCVPREFIN